MTGRFLACCAVVLVAASPLWSDEPRRPAVTRADLALALQRFEGELRRAEPKGEDLVQANLVFEEVTRDFFRMSFGPAIGKLNDHALAMRLGRVPTLDERWLASLKVVVEPPIVVTGEADPVARITSLSSVPDSTPRPLVVVLEKEGVTRSFPTTPTVNERGGSEGEVALPAPEGGWSGSWSVSLRLADEPSAAIILPTGRFLKAVPRNLDEVREENRARLARLPKEDEERAPARIAVEARNELLKMNPNEALSVEFLADVGRLTDEVAGEIAQLESGKDPFAGRRGDYWRVIRQGTTKIPFRVYVPADLPLDEPVPLVVALHGAGGDENMFMDAYGLGELRRQADRRGFIAVSPATFYFMSRGDYLTALVEEMARCYPIDRQRVYVLGHSMGGAATSKQAVVNVDSIAAAACIAGFAGFADATDVAPTLVLAAELDAIIPKERIEQAARAALDAKLPVEYELIPNYGHTLVVEAQLGRVIDWLLEHARPGTPSTTN